MSAQATPEQVDEASPAVAFLRNLPLVERGIVDAVRHAAESAADDGGPVQLGLTLEFVGIIRAHADALTDACDEAEALLSAVAPADAASNGDQPWA